MMPFFQLSAGRTSSLVNLAQRVSRWPRIALELSVLASPTGLNKIAQGTAERRPGFVSNRVFVALKGHYLLNIMRRLPSEGVHTSRIREHCIREHCCRDQASGAFCPFRAANPILCLTQGGTSLGSLAAFCPGLGCLAPFGARNRLTSNFTLRVLMKVRSPCVADTGRRGENSLLGATSHLFTRSRE